ncbi:hypothetical protein J1614_007424 [Plenodomus biglobosus]|nr:hypothetical protein J1614_007424 [Plenodomus biglobosus]
MSSLVVGCRVEESSGFSPWQSSTSSDVEDWSITYLSVPESYFLFDKVYHYAFVRASVLCSHKIGLTENLLFALECARSLSPASTWIDWMPISIGNYAQQHGTLSNTTEAITLTAYMTTMLFAITRLSKHRRLRIKSDYLQFQAHFVSPRNETLIIYLQTMASTYDSHFGINNVPYGIASSSTRPEPQHVTRIGDGVIHLAELADLGLYKSVPLTLSSNFREKTLNTFAAVDKNSQRQVRSAIQLAYKDEAHKNHSDSVD